MSESENCVNLNNLEQKIDATSLGMQIQAFIRNNRTIRPNDWIVLNGLIKQLNKQGYNESHKVLRSMQNRFIRIQNQYQRG